MMASMTGLNSTAFHDIITMSTALHIQGGSA